MRNPLSAVRAVILALGGMTIAGCAISETTTRGTAYPTPGKRATKEVEKLKSELHLEAKVDGNTVVARVSDDVRCRDVNVTPQSREDAVARSVSTQSQVWLGIGAATLAGAGVVLAVSKCDGTEAECRAYQVGGPVLIGTGALLAGVIVANAIRARDSSEVVDAPPERMPAEWKTCESMPLQDRLVQFAAGSITLAGQTDAKGSVRFDLDQLLPSKTKPEDATVTAGTDVAKLSLRGRSIVGEWEADKNAIELDRALQELEPLVLEMESTATQLEHVYGLWGEKELRLLRAISVLGPDLMRAVESGGASGELLYRSPFKDKYLTKYGIARRLALLERTSRVAVRMTKLAPRAKVAIAAKKQHDDEEFGRLLAGLILERHASGGKFGTTGAETAQSHRDADEERRRHDAQQDCQGHCNSAKWACEHACTLGGSGGVDRCYVSCTAQREACAAGCSR